MCHTHRMMQEIDIINEQYVSVDNDRYLHKDSKIIAGWIQTGDCVVVAVEDSLVETSARHSDESFPPYNVKRKKKTLSIIFIKSGLWRTSVVLTEKILYFSYAIKTELNVSIIDLNTTH